MSNPKTELAELTAKAATKLTEARQACEKLIASSAYAHCGTDGNALHTHFKAVDGTVGRAVDELFKGAARIASLEVAQGSLDFDSQTASPGTSDHDGPTEDELARARKAKEKADKAKKAAAARGKTAKKADKGKAAGAGTGKRRRSRPIM